MLLCSSRLVGAVTVGSVLYLSMMSFSALFNSSGSVETCTVAVPSVIAGDQLHKLDKFHNVF